MEAVRTIKYASKPHGSLQSIRVEGLRRFLEEATDQDTFWFLFPPNPRVPEDRQLIRLVRQFIEGPADLARSNPSHIVFLALGAIADTRIPPRPFEPITNARTLNEYCRDIERLVLMVVKRMTSVYHVGMHSMPTVVERAAKIYDHRTAHQQGPGVIDSGSDDKERRSRLLSLLTAILLGNKNEDASPANPLSGVVGQFVIMRNKTRSNVGWRGADRAKSTLAAIEYAKSCLMVASFIDEDLPCYTGEGM